MTSGIIFGVLSIILLLLVPAQVAIPTFDTGGPSPRIIPYLVLSGMLLCSIGLIVESLVFKREKVVVFDFKVEKAGLLVLGLVLLFGILMVQFGYIVGVVVVLPLLLHALGERKPFIYIFTLAGGIGVYYLFIEIFNISLPAFGG
nr:tripartite tricarboxylate transporter TctB family protein [Anaerotalea alkaliphila]